ncbi:MAG: FMN-binding protein [Clostridia bacterium]|nr:FMN-binding protein [Clostridia bacterium]
MKHGSILKKLTSILTALMILLGAIGFIGTHAESLAPAEVYSGRAIVPHYDYGVTVYVTVNGGIIESITAEHDTNGYSSSNNMYWNWAVNGRTVGGVFRPSPLAQIVETQSTENIDVVTGATFTCRALVQAVENALANMPNTDEGVYALMNIPYEAFYGAENAANFDVDAVSSATNKAGNYNIAGGSFHSAVTAGYDENGELIAVGAENGAHVEGVTWPVYLESEDMLASFEALGGIRVTDEREVTVASAAHGSVSRTLLTGSASLMEAPAYSYYLLSEAPAYYMNATIEGDSPAFSPIQGDAQALGEIDPDVSYTTRWGDVEINLSCAEEASGMQINAMVFTADDGTTAGMIHLYNIWVGSKIGWNAERVIGLDNKKLTSVRFYCNDREGGYFVYDYALDEDIKEVYFGTVGAAFTAPLEIEVSNLPEDAENLTAIAYYSVGKQRFYLTETEENEAGEPSPVWVPIVDGKIALSTALIDERIVSVEFTSDNYAIRKASCEYAPVFTAGDVNADGSVTTADALIAARAALGLIELNEGQLSAADMNGDGSVTVTDAVLILRAALGLL